MSMIYTGPTSTRQFQKSIESNKNRHYLAGRLFTSIEQESRYKYALTLKSSNFYKIENTASKF